MRHRPTSSLSAPATVLLIEDQPDIAGLMRRIVVSMGHEALVASTGPAGIELASLHRPSLILMDIHLPGMRGFEVLSILRGTKRLARIPVICVTALATPADRDQVLASGFDAYVSKPFRRRDLVREIEVQLASTHARGAPAPASQQLAHR